MKILSIINIAMHLEHRERFCSESVVSLTINETKRTCIDTIHRIHDMISDHQSGPLE